MYWDTPHLPSTFCYGNIKAVCFITPWATWFWYGLIEVDNPLRFQRSFSDKSFRIFLKFTEGDSDSDSGSKAMCHVIIDLCRLKPCATFFSTIRLNPWDQTLGPPWPPFMVIANFTMIFRVSSTKCACVWIKGWMLPFFEWLKLCQLRAGKSPD